MYTLTNAKHGEEDDVDYQLPDCSPDIYLAVSGSVHLPGGPHAYKRVQTNVYSQQNEEKLSSDCYLQCIVRMYASSLWAAQSLL